MVMNPDELDKALCKYIPHPRWYAVIKNVDTMLNEESGITISMKIGWMREDKHNVYLPYALGGYNVWISKSS